MQPEKIGPYQIKDKVGEGGTALIYRASTSKATTDVALKVARSGKESKEWVEQLRNESAILAMLSSPALPAFYGYFEDDGYRYIVLEYIVGPNLDEVFTNMGHPVDEQEAIQWGMAICDVLSTLHNREPEPLIYKFIKPDNLMLDDERNLFLIDFGKVSIYEPDKEYPRIGSIGYSAPEQYIGKPEPRSDIFGLGVFLYHLTTCRDPREDATQAFLFHVMQPRSINPKLSESFEDVILKAVEHNAANRYSNADEMKKALAACL